MLYESEGLPGESFVGGDALRAARRQGRVARAATGRGVDRTAVARAWVLQLLVQRGVVIEWPDVYFARVAAIEGFEIPIVPRRPPSEWGPPG